VAACATADKASRIHNSDFFIPVPIGLRQRSAGWGFVVRI
jgi:hypothetical protein